MSTQRIPLLLTARAAARYVGVSISTLYTLRGQGAFVDTVTVPGKSTPMFRREDLRAWVRGLGRESC